MQLIPLLFLLFTDEARATGSAVWLSDTVDLGTTAGLDLVPLEIIAPDPAFTERDATALENLASELKAVRPMVSEFDGELEIMSRLQAAVDDVEVLRDDNDVKLLYATLAFQGYAVQRYFQNTLSSDATAAPYRVRVGSSTEVEAWVDAIAIDPDHVPTARDIFEQPERLAFDESRARVLVAPQATVRVAGLLAGGVLNVDGQLVTIAPWDGGQIRVPPGLHRFAILEGDRVVTRVKVRLEPGDDYLLMRRPQRADLMSLGETLATTRPQELELPVDVAAALGRLQPPVYIAVDIPAPAPALLYRVEGARAMLASLLPTSTPQATDPTVAPRANGVSARMSVGLGFVHDRNYYVLHERDGAPEASPIMNAAAAAVGADLNYAVGPVLFSGGAQLVIPTGSWHHLPVGTSDLRVRTLPYVAAGHRNIQALVGAWLPWHMALGAKGQLDITRHLSAQTIAVVCPGVRRQREVGPTFRPGTNVAAVIGITGALGQ